MKWVDGFINGKTCNEGGGTPDGKVCDEDAKDANGLVEDSGANCIVEVLPERVPPAAKTAGGIACIKVSR